MTHKELITQMLKALESAAPDVANRHYAQLWDAITTAREYLSKDSQESEALAAPEQSAASAVINAAREALDNSTEAFNDAMDIVIPAHLAAALSFCLDEYDTHPAPKAEPVAWMHHIKEPNQDWYSLLSHHSASPWKFTQSYLDRCQYKGVPLYLHPATSVQIESVEPVLWVNSEEDVEFSLKPWMSSEAWKPLFTHPAPKAEPDDKDLTIAYMAGYHKGKTDAQPKAEPVNQQLLEALKLAEAALSDIGDADREPGDDVAWCEARAAKAIPAARAALAAAEQAQGAPEMSTNKIMELADTYACNRHADGHAHMEETPNTAIARAALQAEVECVTKELAGAEAVNKAAAMEIVSLRAELAAAKAEPVNRMMLDALKLALDCQGKMLLTNPPQEAWKYHGVEQKARAAITAAEE